MDIAEWLRKLGLEQYAPGFLENHVGEELLSRLTADDLKELGVASLGHRRRPIPERHESCRQWQLQF